MADIDASSKIVVNGVLDKSKTVVESSNGESKENKEVALIDGSSTKIVTETAPAHATLQKLYEIQAACGCCTKWSEKCPEAITEAVKLAEASRAHSIVLRYAKVHDTLDGNPLKLHSIVVQSPKLKKNVVSQRSG